MVGAMKFEAYECDESEALPRMYAVPGFGMVRVDAAPGDSHLLWLPFQPICVAQRVM